jgi:hypothetical protein
LAQYDAKHKIKLIFGGDAPTLGHGCSFFDKKAGERTKKSQKPLAITRKMWYNILTQCGLLCGD